MHHCAALSTEKPSTQNLTELTFDIQQIKQTIEMLGRVDKKVIEILKEFGLSKQIIHYDPNFQNLLFTGVKKTPKTEHDLLDEADFSHSDVACKIKDFELARTAHPIYDLAMFFYLNSGFPRCFETYLDEAFISKITRVYLKSLLDTENDISDEQFAKYSRALELATLVISFDTYLLHMLFSKIKPEPFHPEIFAIKELEFFNKQMLKIFGTKEVGEAKIT